MPRHDDTIDCPSCQTENDEESKYCKKCGTNLRKKRYSRDDDPMERLDNLEEKVDRILDYVEEDDEEDTDEKKDKTKRRRQADKGGSRTEDKRGRGRGFFGR